MSRQPDAGQHRYVDANLNGLSMPRGRTEWRATLCRHQRQRRLGSGRRAVGSMTTGALGLQLRGLAPGDYIVVVTARTSPTGGARRSAHRPGRRADPDNMSTTTITGVAARRRRRHQTITLRTITSRTARPTSTGTPTPNNLTLDFGFVQPAAGGERRRRLGLRGFDRNDLTAQLLSNDTDPRNDTRKITSATQAPSADQRRRRVLTYTPNANYAGSDSSPTRSTTARGTRHGNRHRHRHRGNDAPVNNVPSRPDLQRGRHAHFNAANSNLISVSDQTPALRMSRRLSPSRPER